MSNLKYRRCRAFWTIVAPKWGPIYKDDMISEDIQKEIKTPTCKAQEREVWVLEATYRLVDQKKTLS